MLSCDVVEEINEEVKYKKEGRDRFLLNGGLKNIVSLLGNKNILSLYQRKEQSDNSQHYASLISLMFDIYCIYSNAYMLANCNTHKK